MGQLTVNMKKHTNRPKCEKQNFKTFRRRLQEDIVIISRKGIMSKTYTQNTKENIDSFDYTKN